MTQAPNANPPMKTAIPANALRLMEANDRDPYFKMSAEERFQDWAKFKVSIAIPVSEDLPVESGVVGVVQDAVLDGREDRLVCWVLERVGVDHDRR